MTSTLIEFTERSRKWPRTAGWPKDEVAAALDAFAAVDFALTIDADGWTGHTSFAKAGLFSVRPSCGTEIKAASMGA
ncbi:MAG: hypothetical protein ACR2KT_16285 [Methylocella sp.]